MDKEERYNYVFDQYDGDIFIYDLKDDSRIDDLNQCANILNKQDQKIKDLEHRLSNCIEPKFKIGQEVWYKPSYTLYSAKIESIKVHYRTSGKVQIQYVVTSPNGFKNHKNEEDLFATKEEVKSKLIGVK